MIWAIVALFMAGNGTDAERDYIGTLACAVHDNVEYTSEYSIVPRGEKWTYEDGSIKFVANKDTSMTFINPVGEIVHNELYPRQTW